MLVSGLLLPSLFLSAQALRTGDAAQAAAPGAAPAVSAARAASRQWCDPVKVYLPKAGFQPLHASAAQLAANGFPARPPASDGAAMASWKQLAEHARHFSAPHPVCSSFRHTLYTGIWAGREVPKQDYSNSRIVQTQAQWTQSAVPGNRKYPSWRTAPDASFWDGINGATKNLIQSGCDSFASKTPTYKCWTEDYPLGTIWEGPAAHPNDLMFTQVAYLGGGITHFVIENETRGTEQSFDNKTPDLASAAAAFITERVGKLYLPDFKATFMSDNRFWQANNTVHSLGKKNFEVIMKSNCKASGVTLAEPGQVIKGGFVITWKASGPVSNTCKPTT